MKDSKNYLKWKVDLADGFEWVEDQDGDTYIKETLTDIKIFVASECFEDFNMFPVLNPLLLNNAIDGFNKSSYFSSGQIEIVQLRWGIQIKDYSTDKHDKKYFKFESYDNHKESALEYLYEESS